MVKPLKDLLYLDLLARTTDKIWGRREGTTVEGAARLFRFTKRPGAGST